MKIRDSKDFGQALRERRKALGYTQSYISEYTGLSVSFISELENGKATAELGKTIEPASLLAMDLVLQARGEDR